MSFSSYLQERLKDGCFADAVLEVHEEGAETGEVKEIRVHTLILGRSEYFRTMFVSGFREGLEQQAGIRKLHLEVASLRNFEQVLQYLYMDGMDCCCRTDEWSEAALLDLLLTCDYYQVPVGAEGKIMDTLVEKIKLRGVQAAWESAQYCWQAGHPPRIMQQVADVLADLLEFGTGHLLQVLAWSFSAAKALDLARFQEKCLEKVTGDFGGLESELEGPVKVSRLLLSQMATAGRGLILAWFVLAASDDDEDTDDLAQGARRLCEEMSLLTHTHVQQSLDLQRAEEQVRRLRTKLRGLGVYDEETEEEKGEKAGREEGEELQGVQARNQEQGHTGEAEDEADDEDEEEGEEEEEDEEDRSEEETEEETEEEVLLEKGGDDEATSRRGGGKGAGSGGSGRRGGREEESPGGGHKRGRDL